MKVKGIGICEWALPTPLRGPVCCRVLKDFGLDAVELEFGTVEENFPLCNDYIIDLYKEEQAKYGTVFTGVAVNLTDFYDMSAPLGTADREMVEYALRTAVDTAHKIGAPLIHVPTLHGLKSEVAVGDEEGMANTSECLQRICDYAKGKDVVVCSENDFTTEQQLTQIRQVDRDNFGIYFDTQNPHALAGLYTPDLVRPIFDRIQEFHVKDGFDVISTHTIGEGDCDPFKTLEVFDEMGYTGWIVLENYFWRTPMCGRGDDPYALLRKDIDIVRKWLSEHE